MEKKALRVAQAVATIAAIIAVLAAVVWMQRAANSTNTATEYVVQDPADMPKGPAPVFGMIESQTDTTVTVSSPSGQRTFTVTSDTQVISQVSAGVTAKTLSRFASGTQVLVVPMPGIPSQARSINVLPSPLPIQPDAALVSVTGQVTAKSASSVVVETAEKARTMVRITASTDVVSNALAGQKGAGLAGLQVGMQVSAVGTLDSDGALVASRLQLIVPLAN